MPGKHVPPGPAGALEKVNELIKVIPPTNGWMVELGEERGGGEFFCGYRIYVSGDTLFVDDLKAIPERYPHVDLMLVHLGKFTPERHEDFAHLYLLRRNNHPRSAPAVADGNNGRRARSTAPPFDTPRRDYSNPQR